MRIQRHKQIMVANMQQQPSKVAFKKRHIPILVGPDVTYLVSPISLPTSFGKICLSRGTLHSPLRQAVAQRRYHPLPEDIKSKFRLLLPLGSSASSSTQCFLIFRIFSPKEDVGCGNFLARPPLRLKIVMIGVADCTVLCNVK